MALDSISSERPLVFSLMIVLLARSGTFPEAVKHGAMSKYWLYSLQAIYYRSSYMSILFASSRRGLFISSTACW